MFLEEYSKIPIAKNYSLLDGEVEFLKKHSKMVTIPDHPLFVKENIYFKEGIDGTQKEMFLREALLIRLLKVEKLLLPKYSFFIFDAFRSRKTQQTLFDKIKTEVIARNPQLNEKEIFEETKKYVAHPDDHSRFQVLPHNSGGALDIGLCENGKLLDFGTPFDDPSDKSITDYFEKDSSIVKKNRRMLFHLMKSIGFTNYEHEWWHYDLGNCLWGKYLNTPYIFSGE